jgi:hypothetical protein
MDNMLRESAWNIGRAIGCATSMVAGILKPTIPFALICLLAIGVDVYTAWRLEKRVVANNPHKKALNAGKFKSSYARRVFNTIFVIYSCILLGYMIDTYCYPDTSLNLANWIAGGFCGIQIISILENESSENPSLWARLLQKIIANKAMRHLNINLEEIISEIRKEEKKNKTEKEKGEEKNG